MNKSKKIGMAIFLFLIGSLEARNRITNEFEEIMHEVEDMVTSKKPSKSSAKKKSSSKSKKPQMKKATVKKSFSVKAQKDQNRKQERRDKNDRMRSVSLSDISYQDSSMVVNIGVSKFAKGSETKILDASQTNGATGTGLINDASVTDRMVPVKTKAMPIVGALLQAHYTGIPARWREHDITDGSLGLQFTFAKADDSMIQDYYDGDATTTALRTFQDTKQYKLEVVGGLDLYEKNKWILSTSGSLGLAVGTVKNLRLYEKSNDVYYNTGQYVQPKKAQFTGGIGVNISREIDVDYSIRLGYNVNWTRERYDGLLRIGLPETGAPAVNTTNYNLLANDAIRDLLKVTVGSNVITQHAFTLGIERAI